MTFRRFSPEMERRALLWRDLAFSEQHWNVVGEVGAGESGALIVEERGGLRAVAKPAVGDSGNFLRGAHEKIASDLAFDLDLPVPPVLLWREGPGHGRDRLFSLSLWGGFDQFEYWNVAEAHGLIDDRVRKSVSEAVAAIALFHEWISAHDRKPEHFLIDLAADPESMGIAVIDHANTMSAYWTRCDHRDWPEPYQLTGVPKNGAAMELAASKITSCNDATIRDICARIPLEFLPDDRRDIIVSNLGSRKLEIEQRFSNARGATA